MELRPYSPPSFFSPRGAYAKRRQLEKKGFPTNLRGWRFVTLTIDRNDYADGESAFEAGNRHLRQFIYELRSEYSIDRWCWKLEFHAPDERGEVYPHWHLLIDHKAKIDKDHIRDAWRLGRTNIKAVKGETLDYIFKYATKDIQQLPEWILQRHMVRFFQVSPGFFPEKPSSADCQKSKKGIAPSPRGLVEAPDDETKIGCSRTIGERIKKWSQLVVRRTVLDSGEVRHSMHRNFYDSWGLFLGALAQLKLSLRIPCSELTITTDSIITTCLQPIYGPPVFK